MALTALLQGQGDNDGCTAPLPKSGVVFSGRVMAVLDGDSACVSTSGLKLIEVRLADFYAPESSQPGGDEAADMLARLAMGEQVTCLMDHTSFDRAVSVCTMDGISLGGWMRAAGVAEGGRGR